MKRNKEEGNEEIDDNDEDEDEDEKEEENDEQVDEENEDEKKHTKEDLTDDNNNTTDLKYTRLNEPKALDQEEAVGGGELDEMAKLELYDKFDDNLHLDNKQFRAYRDKKEGEQADSTDEDDDDDGHSCTTTTSTIMDARTVRGKVRKSILSKIKTERRRIRNKGESALITEKNREINDNIKASIHFFK